MEPFSSVLFVTVGRKAGAALEAPLILVVEDDEAVQNVLDDTLTEGGFKVAAARTGEEAVTLIKGARIPYRALVTDIQLRGRFDGWEVARAAREVDASFPVVYMSAANADRWPVDGVPNSLMLRKPFAPTQLLTAISQLLNAAPPMKSSTDS